MKYSALTPELLAMTRELEDLGGGDARIGRAAVCVVASAMTGCQSVLHNSAGGLTVQDPRSCYASRDSKGSKLFPLSNFQDEENSTALEDTLTQASVKWLFDGFNATLLAFGQTGMGKSSTLFAEGCHAQQPLFHSILQQIFAQELPAAPGRQTCRIGFSFWEVLQHQVVDLLAAACQQDDPTQALHSTAADWCQCVEAFSVPEALALLHAAQCNSSNWISDQHGHIRPLPNRAHLFVRIVLYDTCKQQISTLHVVDLAGNQSLSPHQSNCSSQKHQDKLAINQQLLSLSKLVSEVSRLSTSQDSAAKQVTSARDGTLMQLVGPLLAGNARTFMLAAVSPNADDYLDTVNTLRIATRAQNIQTACMRTTGVRPEHVCMVPAAHVLGKVKESSMWGRNSSNRHQGTELQRSASRQYIGQQLTGASTNAQSRQETNAAHRSVPKCAEQDRQWATEMQQQQQQQLDVGFPAAAAVDAEASSGHHGHADPIFSVAAPKQQSCHQFTARPASSNAFEPSVSGHLGSGRAGAGLRAEDMGDDLCGPMELTWEGSLQGASANGQEPRAPGSLAAEPSFAFQCKSHLASANQGPPPPSRCQQLSTSPTRSATPDGSTGSDARASLHQPFATLSASQQQLTATNIHAVHYKQAAESSGQHNSSDLQQPNAWPAAPDCCQWEPLPPPADETVKCYAAGWEASAYTPQELADHMDKLKKEFRQICSTILDGDVQLPEAAATVTSARQCGGPVACERLPIISKHSATQQPGSPPCLFPSSEVTIMPAPPCVIPCCAVDWPPLDMSTRTSSAQQQQLQPKQQPHHVMQQPQQQTGSSSMQSMHSSSGNAAQASAPQQQHAKRAVAVTNCHDDRGVDDAVAVTNCHDDRGADSNSSSISLAAHDEQLECLGQASAVRTVWSIQAEDSRQERSRQQETGRLQQKPMSRQQETCQLQETHNTSGRDGSAVGEGMALAQDSSRAFVDGLRTCSPSERCSPNAAARASHLLTAGQGNSDSKQQEVNDLQVNNEALLCMLERERHHSQRLAEALQQAEANALESSLEQAVQLEEGHLAAVSLRSKCRKLESESLFADVFEKYEEEIRQLQGEVQQLKQSNVVLSQRLALHEVEGPRSPQPRPPLKQMPVPSQKAARSEGCNPCADAKLHEQASQLQLQGNEPFQEQLHTKLSKGEYEVGQGELRLQALRKQLKRITAQCDALKAELAEGKRRDRTAELYKKKANDGVRRVSELQKEVTHLKQELHTGRLAAVQAADGLSQLQGNKEFLEAEHISVLAANQDLQTRVETLREQVRLLRSQRQRAVVLAHLPALRPEAQTHAHSRGPSPGCAALDLARRLQLEPAQTPKMAALIERVADEVHLLLGDRNTFHQRESLLMDLLTGHSF